MLCGPRNGRVAVNQVDLGGQSALGGLREEQDVPSRCYLFNISQQLNREGLRCYFEQTCLRKSKAAATLAAAIDVGQKQRRSWNWRCYCKREQPTGHQSGLRKQCWKRSRFRRHPARSRLAGPLCKRR